MDLLLYLVSRTDRLAPVIDALLDHFRDERVPLHISVAIVGAAALVLAVLAAWGGVAWLRLFRLRKRVRSCGTGRDLIGNFSRLEDTMSRSLLGGAWAEYRQCLKETNSGLRYLRRPDAYFGLDAIGSGAFPARFFAASHGYFIGVGLLMTFIGLVAALKFAAAGVASPNLAVARDALNALLAAASFKFMTSIAGLGSSLVLSVAARSVSYGIESAARGLACDLEQAMAPVVTESLVYDQAETAAAQLRALERLGTALAGPQARSGDVALSETLQPMLAGFFAEMRRAAGGEMNELAAKLSHVGDAIGQMQTHIGQSGQQLAAQLDVAAARLFDAATALQQSVEGRSARVGAGIDALAATLARGEAVLTSAAEKAARGMLGGFATFDASLQAQIGSMREIVGALDRARQSLDMSAAHWVEAAAPVTASVDASRAIAAELGDVAKNVGTAQRNMAEMAKAVAQLSERIGTVWDSYRTRFEKVDDDLRAVFERLQGGTRAFGEEFMGYIGKLDTSLANGMQAFSLGTEELREVAQLLAGGVEAKAA